MSLRSNNASSPGGWPTKSSERYACYDQSYDAYFRKVSNYNPPPTPEPSPRAAVSVAHGAPCGHPYFRESIKALDVRASTAIIRLALIIACSGGAFSRLLHTFKKVSKRPSSVGNQFIYSQTSGLCILRRWRLALPGRCPALGLKAQPCWEGSG